MLVSAVKLERMWALQNTIIQFIDYSPGYSYCTKIINVIEINPFYKVSTILLKIIHVIFDRIFLIQFI